MFRRRQVKQSYLHQRSRSWARRLLLAALLLHAGLATAKTDHALTKAANTLISQIAKEDQCSRENRDARRYHRFDLNADGELDVLMLFTIEGADCGNNYSFHMAVFYKLGDDYRFVDHKSVGGKWGRGVDFNKVTFRDGQILLNTLEYHKDGPHPDPACCPSLKRQARFEVQEGKLVEIMPKASVGAQQPAGVAP